MPLSIVLALVVLAQPPAPLWQGVYSANQAARGKTVYEARCSRCHRTDLNGVTGSALAGEGFMRHWEAHTLEHLFRKIRDTMPPGGDGALPAGETLDLVAYLLEQNGFPDGATDLASTALESIQIAGRTGPAAPRTGAVVQVTGCLRETPEHRWLLIDATEPEVTTLDTSQPAARPDVATTGGRLTLRLLNVFPNPQAHADRIVRAKGFLVRDPAADGVNVVTLEPVGPAC
jgi:cytochrome c5